MSKRIRIVLCVVLSLCLTLGGIVSIHFFGPQDTQECPDGECDVPEYDETGNQVYAIVSPVGYHDVEMLNQAPRLDTLEGKTIALVGGSFMASTTFPELKKCILETYPTATVYMLQEVGISFTPFSLSNFTILPI